MISGRRGRGEAKFVKKAKERAGVVECTFLEEESSWSDVSFNHLDEGDTTPTQYAIEAKEVNGTRDPKFSTDISSTFCAGSQTSGTNPTEAIKREKSPSVSVGERKADEKIKKKTEKQKKKTVNLLNADTADTNDDVHDKEGKASNGKIETSSQYLMRSSFPSSSSSSTPDEELVNEIKEIMRLGRKSRSRSRAQAPVEEADQEQPRRSKRWQVRTAPHENGHTQKYDVESSFSAFGEGRIASGSRAVASGEEQEQRRRRKRRRSREASEENGQRQIYYDETYDVEQYFETQKYDSPGPAEWAKELYLKYGR